MNLYFFRQLLFFISLYLWPSTAERRSRPRSANYPGLGLLGNNYFILLTFFFILYKKTLIFKLELTSSKFYIIVLPLFLVRLKTFVAKPMHLQINNLSLIHIKITKIYSLSANVSKEKCFHYWQQRIVVFVSVANTKININNSRNIH